MKVVSTIAALATCILTFLANVPVQASTIVNDNNNCCSAQIQFFQPIGQSFTAIDSNLLSIAFGYVDMNSSSPNDPVTMDLLAGDGTGGELIASRTFTLPVVLGTLLNLSNFFDVDFSGTTLTVGAISALLTTTSPKAGVAFGDGNLYSGGQMYFNITDILLMVTAICPFG